MLGGNTFIAVTAQGGHVRIERRRRDGTWYDHVYPDTVSTTRILDMVQEFLRQGRGEMLLWEYGWEWYERKG